MDEKKDFIVLSIVSIVAIIAIVLLVLSNGGISGQVPKAVLPDVVTLTSPNDSSTTTLTPTLDWSRAHRADFIILYLDNKPGFSTPIVQEFQLRKNELAYTVPAGLLQPGVTYYWRIVSYNDNGATNSATWSFTTQ